jgi:hypothetical protein
MNSLVRAKSWDITRIDQNKQSIIQYADKVSWMFFEHGTMYTETNFPVTRCKTSACPEDGSIFEEKIGDNPELRLTASDLHCLPKRKKAFQSAFEYTDTPQRTRTLAVLEHLADGGFPALSDVDYVVVQMNQGGYSEKHEYDATYLEVRRPLRPPENDNAVFNLFRDYCITAGAYSHSSEGQEE